MDPLPFSITTLIQIQNEILIKPISTDEVTVVVKELQYDKAPDPDGFRALFFQNF